MPAIVAIPIVPQIRGGDNYIEQALYRAEVVLGQKIGRAMLRDYRKTVQTWTKKPRFRKEAKVTRSFLKVTAGTDNEIYAYVDKGTRRHIIRPKPSNKKGLLFFRSGYRAKTRRGFIGSTAGGSFGKVVVARKVDHPGSEGRHFSVTIQEKRRPWFLKLSKELMVDIADAVNNKIVYNVPAITSGQRFR